MNLNFLTKGKCYITIFTASILVSCSEKEVELTTASQAQISLTSEQLLQKKKMSKLANKVGELVTSKENILKEITSSMNKLFDPNLDVISFASLLGKNSNSKKSERYLTKSKKNLTSKSLIKELMNAKLNGAYNEFELFFPFEKIHSATGNINRITVSYAPLNNVKHNEGFVYQNGILIKKVDKVDYNYILKNPTLIILPVDEDLDNLILAQHKRNKISKNKIYQKRANEIKTNQSIDGEWQNSIISTIIPEIRLSWGDHVDIFGLGSKIVLATGGADYDSPNPSPTSMVRSEHFVSLWDIKFGNWVSYNQDFDNDWTRLEREVEFVAVSKHHFHFDDVSLDFDVLATALCNANFNIGLEELLTGEFNLPSLNCEVNGGLQEVRLSGHIGINDSKFHANKKMLREQVLGSNFGGLGYGTKNVDGRNYTIRKLGNIEFYLKNYQVR